MSAADFIIGQAFSPYKLFTGIFIPEGVCKCPDLSAGAKIVYGRLCRFAGEDGKAYPAVPTVGRELGISGKQARRYVRELEEKNFIRADREPGRTSHYVFLWHAAFEGTPLPYMGVPEVATPPIHGSTTPPKDGSTPLPCMGDEESHKENQLKESQSSSGVLATPVSDDDPFFSENEKPKTPDLVVTAPTINPEDLAALVETARHQLQMARAQCLDVPLEQVTLPDRAITTRILSIFTELVDFETWLAGTIHRGLARKARDSRWGLYETDACNHRADILQQRRTAEQRAADEAAEAERQRAAKAAEVDLLDTPMPALRAFGLIQYALNGSGVPGPLKATLERTGALISPNELKRQIREWKRCPPASEAVA